MSIAELPAAVRAAPLYTVTLPGTHNSAAGPDGIIASARVAQSAQGRMVERSARLRRFASRWLCCQHQRITEQLDAGVRAFDFRYSYDAAANKFWFSHSYAVAPAVGTLWSMRQWAEQHPREVLYLRIVPDWANRAGITERVRAQFERYVADVFAPLAWPHNGRLSASIDDMVAARRTVAVSLRGAESAALREVRERRLGGSWPSDPLVKQARLDAHSESFASSAQHNVLELTLTPSAGMITRDLLNPLSSSSNAQLNAQLRPLMASWLAGQRGWRFGRCFCVTLDFPLQVDIAAIYSLNLTR